MKSWWHQTFRRLQGEPDSPPPGMALRTGAAALAWLYGLGAWGRRRLYDRGWLSTSRLPCPVLSIGNLAVGGVGKTPITGMLAQRWQAAGCRVAIVSRGYGGKHSAPRIISNGSRIFRKPPQAGDEAYLLALQLPGIPIITGADRHRAGLLAWKSFHPDLILLDDGFQHFQLHRDVDVVLLDADRPLGNGCLLPRGPLREPIGTLARPLVLILTRYEAHRHQNSWEEVRATFPQAIVLRAVFRLSHAVRYPGAYRVSLADLSGLRLVAVAGLARPQLFAASLQEAGIISKEFFPFPDHHLFTGADLAELGAAACRLGAEGLVTTAKDWARLGGMRTGPLPWYVVHLQVNLLDDWPEHLLPECGRILSD